MKKVISLLLALTLVLAIAPMAFAETAAEEVFVNDFDSVDDTLTVTAAGAAGIDTTNMWLRLWPNIGNTGTNANETAHHNNATGPSSMSTDATYNDQTVVWDFDLMRHQDSTDRIVPRYTDSARYSFGPGIDIRP
ncbi:MAG: hypothetical protein Q4B31_03940, partial [Clostridia bacterium]|nr:hypothetical protein [Clostridia bacterium]